MNQDFKNLEELAEKFYRGFSMLDLDAIRAVCSEDCISWSNISGVEEKFVPILMKMGPMLARLKSFDRVVKRRIFFGSGWIQEHDMNMVFQGGQAVMISACHIVDVENEKIVKLNEYVDSAASAEVDGYLNE